MPEARAISPAAIPVKEASHFPMAAACNRHGVVKRIHEGPANQMKTAEIQSASGYPMKINDVSLLHLIYTEPHAQNTVKRSIAIVRHCQAAHAAGYSPLGGILHPPVAGSSYFLSNPIPRSPEEKMGIRSLCVPVQSVVQPIWHRTFRNIMGNLCHLEGKFHDAYPMS